MAKAQRFLGAGALIIVTAAALLIWAFEASGLREAISHQICLPYFAQSKLAQISCLRLDLLFRPFELLGADNRVTGNYTAVIIDASINSDGIFPIAHDSTALPRASPARAARCWVEPVPFSGLLP
jgi:hypothetical protein